MRFQALHVDFSSPAEDQGFKFRSDFISYAGYLLPIADRVMDSDVRFDVLLGAVTGYRNLSVAPAAVAVITAPINKDWRLHVNVLPVPGGFAHLSVGYVLK